MLVRDACLQEMHTYERCMPMRDARQIRNMFYLLTVQELDGDENKHSKRQQDSPPNPSRSYILAAPAPAPYYGLPRMHPG